MVILLHAYGEDRSTFDPLVPVLHRAGFAVLAIDLRGHGESVEPAVLKLRERVQQRDPKLFRDMVHDVEAAYRWLARRPEADPARFVLVGASVGGSVALDYAVRDKSVDGVVMMTPGADYLGIDSIASARKYSARRLLLLASQEERQAADEMGHMVSNSKVKIVADKSATSTESADPKALHGTRMFGKVPGIEAAITEFIVEAAGPPSDSPVLPSLKGSTFYEQSSRQADQINRDNLRYFSSAAEAEARGYHPPKTRKK